MAKRIRLRDINAMSNAKIFFDANVWIFICGNTGPSDHYSTNRIRYSEAYKNILKSNNTIVTDIMVLSEFINRYLRLSYNLYKEENNKPKNYEYKKDYRKTADYKNALKEVFYIVKTKIIAKSKSQICNEQYTQKSLTALMDADNREMDFNDAHIAHICKENNMYLLTKAGDFKNADMNIISSNYIFWKTR